jgi:alkaline phosphatase
MNATHTVNLTSIPNCHRQLTFIVIQVPDNMKPYYKDIARQLVEEDPGRKMNVIFGGGRDFLGASKPQEVKVKFGGGAEKSCNRTDQQNLVEKYLSQFDNETNVQYVTTSGELVGLDYDNVDQVLGLFANNHMSYESIRDKSCDQSPQQLEE